MQKAGKELISPKRKKTFTLYLLLTFLIYKKKKLKFGFTVVGSKSVSHHNTVRTDKKKWANYFN